jgi:ABC-2 type transport system permease protein
VLDLVAAEWLKLRTARVLLGMIPAAILISVAAVAGMVLSHDGGIALESSEGVRRALSVSGSGAILVLVLGITISAGEYRHGTAADTFLTTPQRPRVLAAKLMVGAAVGAAAGITISLACAAAATLLYSSEGATFPLGSADVWLSLSGAVVYTSLFAVLGVAVGSLIRNQVVAVAGALVWFAIVEHTLVNLLPEIGRWLPAAAGQAIVRTPLAGLLTPLAGTALLLAYSAAVAATGIRIASTRDA